MTQDNSIKLGDFGISRLIESTLNVSTKAGTYMYMSPEIRKCKIYSFNTDCWSTGCVLFELITLERFGGIDHNDEYEKINQEIISLQTSDLFTELLTKMLHPDQEQRFSSAQAKLIIENY